MKKLPGTVRPWSSLLAVGLLVVFTYPVRAVEQADIDRAIQRGIAALRALQRSDGTWQHAEIGATALAGLTLLECDVPPDDKAVQKAAARVRVATPNETHTYSLALSILFLDRLDKRADTPLIESMVVRLLAGQTATGGWGYTCPSVSPAEQRRLAELVGDGTELKGSRDLPPLPAKGKRTLHDVSREIQVQLAGVPAARPVAPPGVYIPTDNSNTQFATLGLWVGRRYGIPVRDALLEVDRRFRGSQGPDGTWGYVVMPAGTPAMGVMGASASMTCAGVLALACGHGVAADVARSRDPGVGPRDLSKDNQLKLALQALGTAVGAPLSERRFSGVVSLPSGRAGGRAYYFLWSLERVAVALKLETIGKKDWYAWGAEVLLNSQAADGSWQGEYGAYGADTCFALLFLRRANLVADLSGSIKSLADPGEKMLRAGGVGGGGLRGVPELPSTGIESKPGEKGTAGESRPTPPRTGPAAGLGRELVAAPAERRGAILEQLREGKGVAYTEELASAIPSLEGTSKRQAREALAQRLTRMKAATLRHYLKDEDAEIRRAAALASAMKEIKEHIPDLIRMLSDREPAVQRAALAALKELTGQDFGPRPEADRAERARAIAAWETWWSKQVRE
jgi:hypothetical protein